MTKIAPPIRPAASAIAAFLALSTPAAFAQDAPIVPMTPPVAAPTTPAPPTIQPPATVAAPAEAPAAQPVIRVPLDLPPVSRATEREAAAPPARARAERPTQRAAAPAPTATARAAAAPAADPLSSAAPAEVAAPIAAPKTEPVQPAADVVAAPVETTATNSSGFPWEIAGGAAALLIVGSAGLAFARRRRVSSEVWTFDESATGTEWVPAAEPAFAAREEIAPTPETRLADPASTPTFAAAPSGSMGRHEAMAMAGPTPENPFSTRSKRLARARFLDRQERTAYDATLASAQPAEPARKPVSAWEISQRQAPTMPAEQEVRRLERGRTARADLKPGWTRN